MREQSLALRSRNENLCGHGDVGRKNPSVAEIDKNESDGEAHFSITSH